ncbi:glycoside hydrolase family 19 protein [Methylobacterium gregans]|uniref:glycoside hydrolase family 19 protein n=1 Tax=Methylobacterium gregans TaxID=374424 RepID=UPI003605F4B5
MTDWKRILRAVAPRARADIVAAFVALDAEIEAAGIATDLRRAHFLAQVVPESAYLTRLEENLNYTTAERIRATWKTRFQDVAAAAPYVRNPKALANFVYGGRMGNNRPGDGWLFRGGGLGMTTGRANYRKAGFESSPEELRKPLIALRTALTFWVDNRCEAYADRDDVVGLRQVWNGGRSESRRPARSWPRPRRSSRRFPPRRS